MAIGGALGALSRWGLNQWVTSRWVNSYPLGTLAANSTGCLLFGLLFGLIAKRTDVPPEASLLAITGFLGAFTTFSTFAFEAVQLAQTSGWVGSMLHIVAHTVFGVLLVILGLWVASHS